MNQNDKLAALKARLSEISDLNSAAAVLGWDQETGMPPGGTPARARQMGTLRRLAHEKQTDPALGKMLDEVQPWAESLPYDSDEASLVRVARRTYERAIAVPPAFVARFTAHAAQTYAVWEEARPKNDFASVRPYLEKTLDLSREMANFYPGYEHVADPLIDMSDYGMKASTVRTVFYELRAHLVPIVQAITAQEPADVSCLHAGYPNQDQEAFFVPVIRALGFDDERGRHDISAHPFTTSFSVGDVRITVRYDERDLGQALFSAMHEAGHAMYE